ncbi:MAG TPA: 30S ribosomal protein S9 [bacterium]|nr:30S ribosomal protein S9 [bacterium]
MATKLPKYNYAKGRRRTSVATIRLFKGKGDDIINEEKVSKVYFSLREISDLYLPLEVTDTKGKYYFTAKVSGGGRIGQIGAIRHALSRALIKVNAAFRPELKKNSLLTRDSRMKERKKTGLKKARKAPQFSKR